MLRRPDGLYTADPLFLNPDIAKAVERLGAAVAFTMSSEIVWSLFDKITPLQKEIPIDRAGTVMPLAKTVRDVGTPRCTATRESYLCFCREERFLLIWGSSTQSILAHGNDVESTLLSLVRYPKRDTDCVTDYMFRCGARTSRCQMQTLRTALLHSLSPDIRCSGPNAIPLTRRCCRWTRQQMKSWVSSTQR
jgi:hypothetical protein